MNINEVIPNIFHLEFQSNYYLGLHFVRFQEFYESPEFRGKEGFNLDEFKSWYIKNSELGKEHNKFSYYLDWDGFNIPSYILDLFYDGKFDPLSKKENKILDNFKYKRGDKFYIIGTREGEDDILNYEIAHGMFYTNENYKRDVLRIIE